MIEVDYDPSQAHEDAVDVARKFVSSATARRMLTALDALPYQGLISGQMTDDEDPCLTCLVGAAVLTEGAVDAHALKLAANETYALFNANDTFHFRADDEATRRERFNAMHALMTEIAAQ